MFFVCEIRYILESTDKSPEHKATDIKLYRI